MKRGPDGCYPIPKAEVVARYLSGERPRDIAERYGCGYRTILKRLHAWGVKVRIGAKHGNTLRRTRGGPLHWWGNQSQYLATSARDGSICLLHRACWEACCGPIPIGRIIHHKNENPTDNGIGNLAMMTRKAHTVLHSTVHGERRGLHR